ncbi:MAG: Fe-S cluster assembly protein SufD [Bdellovibrionales bacterium]|nr:Fe-S cluster assembly protein SufD [Bdellovibrionales bacterium]
MQESEFKSLLNQVSTTHPEFSSLRQSSWSFFQAKGFPTRKVEEWKYTPANFLKDNTWQMSLKPNSIQTELDSDVYNLVFVDGLLDEKNSDLSLNELEVSVIESAVPTNLSQEEQGQHLKNIESLKEKNKDSLYHLNFSLTPQAICIKLKPNQVLKKPVKITYNYQTSTQNQVFYPFIYFHVGAGSKVEVYESYQAATDESFYANQSINFWIEENANVSYLQLQEFDRGFYLTHYCMAELNAHSNFEAFYYTRNGKLTRNQFDAFVNGEGAACSLNGIYLTDGSSHVDNHTTIRHHKPHTTSQQTFKGILDGSSHVVYNGKIIIDQYAQKVDSSQINKNILLSSKAQIDTKPELEVYADDVKANHGAAIGEMDEQELFYFLSRAIDKEKAQAMLARGYLEDVVFKLKSSSLKLVVDKALDNYFRGTK